ncbi:hypothetical protein CTAYLR_004701 [Chrysophaeum taylorii]|uniref:Microtubule-associated protein RP/EB family member 1 n=1 Tax=Chrysophaeum taylorii TaxID=2483200 RepID=A0AAD7XIP8_9STRA|nr:hypothetical protein CTAYLR_004701 [Chrysophaeum taylorii]
MARVGSMDAAYFVGRRELLEWLNSTLALKLRKVEETANGAVACQLMDCIAPGTVALSRVNFDARSEYDMINNYKLLQAAFQKAGVDKPIEVNKLVRAKYQDNLEFMQWFKALYDSRNPVDGYDPTAARKQRPAPAAKPPKPRKQPARHPKKHSAANSGTLPPPPPPPLPSGQQHTRKQQQQKTRRQEPPPDEEDLEALEAERDFYFNKLRDIERFLQSRDRALSADVLADRVFAILYEKRRDDPPPTDALSPVPEALDDESGTSPLAESGTLL